MYDYMIDSSCCKGKRLTDFEKIAEEIDNATSLVQVSMNEAVLMHVYRQQGDILNMKVLRPGNVFRISDNGVYALMNDAKINSEKLKYMGDAFWNEIVEKNMTIFSMDKKGYYFAGETLYKTLGPKLTGIEGKFLRESSMERDIALTKIMSSSEIPDGVALIRKRGNCPKIFAYYTERYKRVPFQILAESVKQFPHENKVTFWEINQKKAEIYIELENTGIDTGHIVPGLLLTTSDTGYYQTSVKMCWRGCNSPYDTYFVQDVLSLKHSGEVTTEKILELMEKAIELQKEFFKKYSEYRTRLDTIHIINNEQYLKQVSNFAKKADFSKYIGISGKKKITSWLAGQYNENVKSATYIFDKIIDISELASKFSNNQKEEFRSILVNMIA